MVKERSQNLMPEGGSQRELVCLRFKVIWGRLWHGLAVEMLKVIECERCRCKQQESASKQAGPLASAAEMGLQTGRCLELGGRRAGDGQAGRQFEDELGKAEVHAKLLVDLSWYSSFLVWMFQTARVNRRLL
ncbi:uncharacterized protein LOC120427471 [Culex pipiens pallens]|uniref:uncharacterized protein LOC120427471 n=1 Tax=Culex pipiens pallens TaxID=42434 RepID=UPI0022AA4E2D|nr:uncharacterized protein LOC120427471 [Culex pipiens pallens]